MSVHRSLFSGRLQALCCLPAGTPSPSPQQPLFPSLQKVNIANQIYDFMDRHIVWLDKDMQQLDKEIESERKVRRALSQHMQIDRTAELPDLPPVAATVLLVLLCGAQARRRSAWGKRARPVSSPQGLEDDETACERLGIAAPVKVRARVVHLGP
jgi:hypothetical protein